MKKIVRKGNWNLFCGVVVIGVFVILYFLGFRITYAPELENSWSAISAFASWAGAFASAFAALVAIRIPKVIADRQDKMVMSRVMRKFCKSLVEIYYRGRVNRPLVTSQLSGRKWSRAAVRRSSCS